MASLPRTSARALTSALKKALTVVDKAVKNGTPPTEAQLEDLYTKFVWPVAVKYAKFGACDTEPRCEAFRALERAVEG